MLRAADASKKLRQPAWTGYTAWPSRLLRPAIVSYA